MVTITIYLEGGVLPPQNNNKQTPQNNDKQAMFNTTRLRESFSKLLRQALPEEAYNLEIKPSGGYVSAANRFKEWRKKGHDPVLLIDLDAPPEERGTRLDELELQNCSNEVFFMIQEMEAWILSQPDKIEKFADNEQLIRKHEDKKIADNSLINGKAVQMISKPSTTLNTIFEQHFQVLKTKRGKVPKAKKRGYGKLKDAPTLLELLDLKELSNSFEDVRLLIAYITSKYEEQQK